MSSKKFTFRERLLFFVAERLSPALILLLGKLCRYRVLGFQHYEAAVRSGKGVILALWHGRMLLPVYHFRRQGISALVSLHRDGEMIARVVQRLGYVTRRGSPKAGGREGFNAMVRDIRAGTTVAIFPDGPTGPRHNLRDGVLQLARLTGAFIVPMSYAARPAFRFRSWDRFMLMKPLSRGVLVLGEPFTVPRRLQGEEEVERQRNRIREALIAVEGECDRLMGVRD